MNTYNFDEATAYLKTSATTLDELLVNAIIPAAKIGQGWCIRGEDLDNYLRSEIERQTTERLECIRKGLKPHAVTGRGKLRTIKPDLDKLAA
jgi:excisionase family DNA binding protein